MNLLNDRAPAKKIYLHIGHGKTGTSSIQSVLAKATADLAAADVLYPFDPGLEEAKRGFVSSGNIPLLDLSHDWLDYCVAQAMQDRSSCKAYIFSSEIIFWYMDQFFSGFQYYRNDIDFEIILTVRNPFDMFCSTYLQWVKRSGVAMSFIDFLVQQDFLECHATQAVTILQRLEELGVKVNVLNYSAIGRDIGSRVLALMNIYDVAAGHIAKDVIVNRSLDAAEFQLLLLINSVYGADAGGRVSDALVNGLPDLPSMKFKFPDQAVALIKRNMQPYVDEINRRLPDNEQLELQPSPWNDDAAGSHFLTSEQAAIAYNVLVNWLQEALTSPDYNADEIIPVASLILLILLGNAGQSRLPINRQTFDIIVEESQSATSQSGVCERFHHHHLLGYFNYFSAASTDPFPRHILISQQLNALAHAGLSSSGVLDLFALIHRVKLRLAIR